LLSVAGSGPSLKARLPTRPAHPHALVRLMEALACWYHLPLHAVLDADASDVVRDAESWAQWTGDVSQLDVSIEWVGRRSRPPRDVLRRRQRVRRTLVGVPVALVACPEQG
jgi:hypothetical protein